MHEPVFQHWREIFEMFKWKKVVFVVFGTYDWLVWTCRSGRLCCPTSTLPTWTRSPLSNLRLICLSVRFHSWNGLLLPVYLNCVLGYLGMESALQESACFVLYVYLFAINPKLNKKRRSVIMFFFYGTLFLNKPEYINRHISYCLCRFVLHASSMPPVLIQ